MVDDFMRIHAVVFKQQKIELKFQKIHTAINQLINFKTKVARCVEVCYLCIYSGFSEIRDSLRICMNMYCMRNSNLNMITLMSQGPNIGNFVMFRRV